MSPVVFSPNSGIQTRQGAVVLVIAPSANRSRTPGRLGKMPQRQQGRNLHVFNEPKKKTHQRHFPLRIYFMEFHGKLPDSSTRVQYAAQWRLTKHTGGPRKTTEIGETNKATATKARPLHPCQVPLVLFLANSRPSPPGQGIALSGTPRPQDGTAQVGNWPVVRWRHEPVIIFCKRDARGIFGIVLCIARSLMLRQEHPAAARSLPAHAAKLACTFGAQLCCTLPSAYFLPDPARGDAPARPLARAAPGRRPSASRVEEPPFLSDHARSLELPAGTAKRPAAALCPAATAATRHCDAAWLSTCRARTVMPPALGLWKRVMVDIFVVMYQAGSKRSREQPVFHSKITLGELYDATTTSMASEEHFSNDNLDLHVRCQQVQLDNNMQLKLPPVVYSPRKTDKKKEQATPEALKAMFPALPLHQIFKALQKSGGNLDRSVALLLEETGQIPPGTATFKNKGGTAASPMASPMQGDSAPITGVPVLSGKLSQLQECFPQLPLASLVQALNNTDQDLEQASMLLACQASTGPQDSPAADGQGQQWVLPDGGGDPSSTLTATLAAPGPASRPAPGGGSSTFHYDQSLANEMEGMFPSLPVVQIFTTINAMAGDRQRVMEELSLQKEILERIHTGVEQAEREVIGAAPGGVGGESGAGPGEDSDTVPAPTDSAEPASQLANPLNPLNTAGTPSVPGFGAIYSYTQEGAQEQPIGDVPVGNRFNPIPVPPMLDDMFAAAEDPPTPPPESEDPPTPPPEQGDDVFGPPSPQQLATAPPFLSAPDAGAPGDSSFARSPDRIAWTADDGFVKPE
eukprot:gene8065-1442_t